MKFRFPNLEVKKWFEIYLVRVKRSLMQMEYNTVSISVPFHFYIIIETLLVLFFLY